MMESAGTEADPIQMLIERHIRTMKWGSDTSADVRTLVEANVRGLIHPLRDFIAAEVRRERQVLYAHFTEVAVDAVRRAAKLAGGGEPGS